MWDVLDKDRNEKQQSLKTPHSDHFSNQGLTHNCSPFAFSSFYYHCNNDSNISSSKSLSVL